MRSESAGRAAPDRPFLEAIVRALRLVAATLLFAAAFNVAPVRATAFSTDWSDLWWITTESGWGIQFVQRGSIIFATIFVYGQGGTPVWYVATMNSADAKSWTGDLYTTTGSYFGMPFTSFTPRKVGTMTWTPSSTTTGALNYTVDGVAVAKNVVRQFITLDNYAGTYNGGIHQTVTNCTDATKNGTLEDFATVAVTQNGATLAFTLSTQLGIMCSYTGNLSQDGRFGTSSGAASCNGGGAKPLTLSAMVVGLNSLVLHYHAPDPGNGCVTDGYLAGARHQ